MDYRLVNGIPVAVAHKVTGRLRLISPRVRSLGSDIEIFTAWLSQPVYVQRVIVRPVTGSVIFFYDPQQVGPDHLVVFLAEVVKNRAILREAALEAGEPACLARLDAIRRFGKGGRPSGGMILHAAILTGYVFFELARRFFFHGSLASGPLSITGLLAVIGAVPLFRSGWKEFREGGKIELVQFVTLACALGVATGEAFTALQWIWAITVSRLLDRVMREKARQEIRRIMPGERDRVFVSILGVDVAIPVSDLQPGDVVALGAGEMVSVGGRVVRGEALVDEAKLTGRSQPRRCGVDDRVYAGTTLIEGHVHLEVERLGPDTYRARMRRLTEDSLARRTEAEKDARAFAVRMLWLGDAVALGTLLFTRSLGRAFSVLLAMSFPAEMVLSVSTAVSAAIANAARRGVLVKGGPYLERLSQVSKACFDKTATLTTEVPEVVAIVPRTPTQDPLDILALAASAERRSTHPMGKALVRAAESRGVPLSDFTFSEEFVGKGVRAMLGGETILVGNQGLMDANGVATTYFARRSREFTETGHSVFYVARNGKVKGMISVANVLRPGTSEILGWLRKDGVKGLYLISGDVDGILRRMSDELGFDGYRATLAARDKAEFVEGIGTEDELVLMVGDGVNDALALSASDVGIAMGLGGACEAVGAADIILTDNDLEGMVYARRLARKTSDVIALNMWIAQGADVFGTLMGVSGYWPPLLEGLFHSALALVIMGNSGRLLFWGTGKGPGSRVSLGMPGECASCAIPRSPAG